MIIMFAISGLAEDFAGIPVGFMGLIYIACGMLLFLPCRFIYNFGKRIHNYQVANSEEDLEIAFKFNKSLWKFIGILCIVSLALIPLSIVLAVVGGVAAMFSGLLS
jgi:hypothetical protein